MTKILETYRGRGVSEYLRRVGSYAAEHNKILVSDGGLFTDFFRELSGESGTIAYYPGWINTCSRYTSGTIADRDKYDEMYAFLRRSDIHKKYGEIWQRCGRELHRLIPDPETGDFIYADEDTYKNQKIHGVRGYYAVEPSVFRHGISVRKYYHAAGRKLLVQIGTELYHTHRSHVQSAIDYAISCHRQRLRSRAAFIDKIGNLSEIWVDKNASSDAGNCAVGTASFVARNKLEKWGAIRADYLLSLQDDRFTRSAITAAILRN